MEQTYQERYLSQIAIDNSGYLKFQFTENAGEQTE